MKTILLFIVSGIIVFITSLSFRLGAFKEVKVIDTPKTINLTMLYKDFTGPYHLINKELKDVETFAKNIGINCDKTFGEFLDDPNTLDASRLRSHVGCIVNEDTSIDSINLEKYNLKLKSLSKQKAIIAHFNGSPSISPYKVYPKVADRFKQLRVNFSYPVIEVYEIVRGSKVETTYYFFINDSY
jgi:hypothetical protein